jgi:hypothetical protein
MSNARRSASGPRAPAHCEILELVVVEFGQLLRCWQDGHARFPQCYRVARSRRWNMKMI